MTLIASLYVMKSEWMKHVSQVVTWVVITLAKRVKWFIRQLGSHQSVIGRASCVQERAISGAVARVTRHITHLVRLSAEQQQQQQQQQDKTACGR